AAGGIGGVSAVGSIGSTIVAGTSVGDLTLPSHFAAAAWAGYRDAGLNWHRYTPNPIGPLDWGGWFGISAGQDITATADVTATDIGPVLAGRDIRGTFRAYHDMRNMSATRDIAGPVRADNDVLYVSAGRDVTGSISAGHDVVRLLA